MNTSCSSFKPRSLYLPVSIGGTRVSGLSPVSRAVWAGLIAVGLRRKGLVPDITISGRGGRHEGRYYYEQRYTPQSRSILISKLTYFNIGGLP